MRTEQPKVIPHIAIKLAYKFAKGNAVFVMNDQSDARKVFENWYPSFLGSNTKAIMPGNNTTGFVRYVLSSLTIDVISYAVNEIYPSTRYERLYKNNSPLSTVKLTFNPFESLQYALNNNHFKIGHVIHHVEEPRYQMNVPSRFVRCNTYHRCPAKFWTCVTACPHCSQNHHINVCPSINDGESAKCAACKDKHRANHPSCKTFLELK